MTKNRMKVVTVMLDKDFAKINNGDFLDMLATLDDICYELEKSLNWEVVSFDEADDNCVEIAFSIVSTLKQLLVLKDTKDILWEIYNKRIKSGEIEENDNCDIKLTEL